MNGQEIVEFCESEFAKCLELVRKKNADYCGGENVNRDAFANFKLVERLAGIPATQAVYVRLSDKFARVGSFIKNGKLLVEDESVEDTLRDFVSYSVLLMGLIREERELKKGKKNPEKLVEIECDPNMRH